MRELELLQLSRYAVVRREGDCLILEQPVSGFSVPIRKPAILQLLFNFVQPTDPHKLLENQNPSSQPVLSKLIDFLRGKSVLVAPEKNHTASDLWQFHDLYFHTQSRRGSNLSALGATYRFGTTHNPENHLRGKMWSGEKINLPETALNNENGKSNTLSEVLEKRITSYYASGLKLNVLSSLLAKSLRIKNVGGDSLVKKYYPSGGSLHSIETYLAIYNCDDLSGGFYYYDALKHSLTGISNQQTLLDSILKNAQAAMGRDDLPAAVLVFSSRFGRVFQKYESLGYRLILIELGAIFQTLYLLAAELNLSVCALGAGNSNEFSASLNLDYFKETSIGEFVINGMF
jgi:oxazoline/thiazoline dehydrogenase